MHLGKKAKEIIKDFDRDLDQLSDTVSLRFERLLQETLDEWAARFSNHSFRAWDGHGLISIDISPPVMGEHTLNYMNPENYRGAIAELISDARILIDTYNTERKSCICISAIEGVKQ